MKKFNNTVDWKIPFIDFQVGLLAIFLLLTIFTLALITPDEEKKTSGLDTKAEYVIFSTWADDQDCDVDMWIKDPLGKFTSFVNKSNDFVTLDRDDRGITIDTYLGPDGNTYVYPDNKEIATFRKIIPGDYYVNLHLYNCRDKGMVKTPGDPKILPVTLEIMKLNPHLETSFKKTITFQKVWEEVTVIHFTLDADGNYKYIDNDFIPMTNDNTPPSSMSSIPSLGGENK